jgi:hypothetical protein
MNDWEAWILKRRLGVYWDFKNIELSETVKIGILR